MPDNAAFGAYAEALGALQSMDSRQREAVRRSVEATAAAKHHGKMRLADQQRMFDRAAADLAEAERLLLELHKTLEVRPPNSSTRPTTAAEPRTLAETRSQIREVTGWASDTKPIAESLMRTKARLEKASKPAYSVQPALPPASVPVARKRSKTAPLVVVALIVIVIVIVIVIH